MTATTPVDTDYTRLGLNPDRVEQWEDGDRTGGRPGTYEWWYFDAHLDDGAKLVVVFQTKNITAVRGRLRPVIRLSLDLPDGRRYERIATFGGRDYSSAKDGADIRIAGNRFSGDLTSYRIVAAIGEVAVDLTLTGRVPAWRPQTGYLTFGRRRQHEFAWLPAVPEGVVTGSYTVDGVAHPADGIGYHDHNWGNIGLTEIVHDWYWARGHAGPYSVIASFITAHERYGYATTPVFLLAENGEIIADAGELVSFETLGPYVDQSTGKPVANVTRYTYIRDETKYVVTFTRHRDLAAGLFTDELKGVRLLAARLVRFDGAYLRFTGELRVEHFVAGTLVNQHVDTAIWELMYFGHAR